MKQQEATYDRSMTLNDFRRRYFSGKSRPSKADVERWIECGDESGNRLRARFIDGKYYIKEYDALTFLQPDMARRPRTAASRRLAAQQARIEDARAILVNKYGFKL